MLRRAISRASSRVVNSQPHPPLARISQESSTVRRQRSPRWLVPRVSGRMRLGSGSSSSHAGAPGLITKSRRSLTAAPGSAHRRWCPSRYRSSPSSSNTCSRPRTDTPASAEEPALDTLTRTDPSTERSQQSRLPIDRQHQDGSFPQPIRLGPPGTRAKGNAKQTYKTGSTACPPQHDTPHNQKPETRPRRLRHMMGTRLLWADYGLANLVSRLRQCR